MNCKVKSLKVNEFLELYRQVSVSVMFQMNYFDDLTFSLLILFFFCPVTRDDAGNKLLINTMP